MIAPKPYNAAEKIDKRIFSGRPSIFTAQDLNQQIDIFEAHLKSLSADVGMIRENWQVNVKLSVDSMNGAIPHYKSEITLLKVVDNQPAYVYANGIRFDIPVGSALPYAGDWDGAENVYPIGYLVLIAKRLLVNFGKNNVLAGVTSDEYPTALPSSDLYQYSGERLLYVDILTKVTLGADEVLIGIIASVIPKDTGEVVVTTNAVNYYPGDPIGRAVFYHAVLLSELAQMFQFNTGDPIMNELGLSTTDITYQLIENNGTLNEALRLLQTFFERKLNYILYGFRAVAAQVKQIFDLIGGVSGVLAEMQKTIEELKKTQGIPIGAILEWEGPISGFFDANGTGLPGTIVENFQICNGNNGTTDRRGRFVVGAIRNIPSTGSPVLRPDVDPSEPSLPANTNPDYTLGIGSRGEASHKLSNAETPKNEHLMKSTKRGDGNAPNGHAWKTPLGDEMGASFTYNFGGADGYHNNLPPYLGTVWIKRIK